MIRCVICGEETEETEGWLIRPRAAGGGVFALCPKHYRKSPTAAYITNDDLVDDQYYTLQREHQRTGRLTG